jgi:large subunit ribosomal protein L28
MPRRCALNGKSVRYGNRVSHSNRKTSRTFAPNLQRVSLISDGLRRTVRLTISTAALRSVQKRSGLDAYLLGTADADLAPEARELKRRLRRALSGRGSRRGAQAAAPDEAGA